MRTGQEPSAGHSRAPVDLGAARTNALDGSPLSQPAKRCAWGPGANWLLPLPVTSGRGNGKDKGAGAHSSAS